MKYVVLMLALLSTGAYAQLSATQALQSVLGENQYDGEDDLGEPCVVDVIRESGQTRVELTNTDVTRFMVVDTAPYELRATEGLFSTALTINGGTNVIELTFSVKRSDEIARVVSFQRTLRRPDGQQWTSVQRCFFEN